MSLKERLKNNPWLTNWKYPLTYFILGAVAVMLFISISVQDEHLNLKAVYTAIPAFTVILYFLRIPGYMLSVNFTINNHRHTPLLFGVIIITLSLMAAYVRTVVWSSMEIGLIYIATALFAVGVINHIFRRHTKIAKNMVSFGTIIVLLGLLQYSIASYLLVDYGGITLIILFAGLLLGAFLIAAGVVVKKSQPVQEVSLASLKTRFNKHLDYVFRGTPPLEKLNTLKEQLRATLVTFAEESLALGISEDKLYDYALDSLGDYSMLIHPYKKNMLARFAGSYNIPSNITFTSILQLTLTFSFMKFLDSNDIFSGSSELLIEIPALLIISVIVAFDGLIWLRVFENFYLKRHKFTSLCIGAAALIPIMIMYYINSLDSYGKLVAIPLFLYLIGGVVLASFIGHAVIMVVTKKKADA